MSGIYNAALHRKYMGVIQTIALGCCNRQAKPAVILLMLSQQKKSGLAL